MVDYFGGGRKLTEEAGGGGQLTRIAGGGLKIFGCGDGEEEKEG